MQSVDTLGIAMGGRPFGIFLGTGGTIIEKDSTGAVQN